METPVPFPAELRPYRAAFDQYLDAKLRQFGNVLLRKISNGWTPEQIRSVIDEAMATMHQLEAAAAPQRPLRLVIRHDCQSTGCGDQGCALCQYNPSRLCTRNVKPKYLIDDHLKAKCGAQLRVELVDDTGTCHAEGLPVGVRLELQVLNGEKYKELCPDNTLLSVNSIKSCIINGHQKALLRRDGMSETDLQVFLPLERGSATLSDLTLTTSSEALLSGKAPTFRLLVWAVQGNGEPVQYVTYVVSESFVVATKRVKGAIKSDIPSVMDGVSKLVHIGKATVDKLTDLRTAFQEEGFDFKLPEDLIKVEKVGQFKKLIDMSESSNDLRNRLRHVLKLSPEKWEEVCQHAMSAVAPDFRNRVWWCVPLRLGLLYACKNGAVQLENPIGIVKPGATQEVAPQVIQLQQLDPQLFSAIPRLKTNAVQNWYMTSHPNWAIFETGEEAMAPAGGPVPSAAVASPAAAAAVAAGAGAAGGLPNGAAAAGVAIMAMGPNMVGMAQPAAYTLPGGPPSPVLAGLAPAGPGGVAYGRDMYGQPGIAYSSPDPGSYGVGAPGGLGDIPMPLAGLSPLPIPVPGGHRISSSSPFALQQPSPAPQQIPQPQQQSPVATAAGAVKTQGISPPGAVGPGVIATGPAVRGDRNGSIPSSAGGASSGTSSGLVGGSGGGGGHQAVGGIMGASPPMHPPAAGAPGSGNTSGGASRSPFAADAMMMNIADCFPKFHGIPPNPQNTPVAAVVAVAAAAGGGNGQLVGHSPNDAHCSTTHHLGDGGHGHQTGSIFSLEMLKTDDLMTNGLNSLTGNDTFRSTDWLQQLHGIGGQPSQLGGINSYTMVDVAPPHDGGGGSLLDSADADGGAGRRGQVGDGNGGADADLHGPHGDACGGLVGLESERRLSCKLNSITLDY